MKEPKLVRFESVNWAVFNCSASDKEHGRKAVLAKYGPSGWEGVKAKMTTGIMELFHHKPTPAMMLYAYTVAAKADARHAKNDAKKKASAVTA